MFGQYSTYGSDTTATASTSTGATDTTTASTGNGQKFDAQNFDWAGITTALTGLGLGIADRVTGYGDTSTVATPTPTTTNTGNSWASLFGNTATEENKTAANPTVQYIQTPTQSNNNSMLLIAGGFGLLIVGLIVAISLKK